MFKELPKFQKAWDLMAEFGKKIENSAEKSVVEENLKIGFIIALTLSGSYSKFFLMFSFDITCKKIENLIKYF